MEMFTPILRSVAHTDAKKTHQFPNDNYTRSYSLFYNALQLRYNEQHITGEEHHTQNAIYTSKLQ